MSTQELSRSKLLIIIQALVRLALIIAIVFLLLKIVKPLILSVVFWIAIEIILHQKRHQKINKQQDKKILEQAISSCENQLQQQQYLHKEYQLSHTSIQRVEELQEQLAKVHNSLVQEREKNQTAKDFEEYILEEHRLLETKNQKLCRELQAAKEQIRYWVYRANDLEQNCCTPQENFPEEYDNTDFLLILESEARESLKELDHLDKTKHAKVLKTLSLLSTNPHHPSLQSHEYQSLSTSNGKKVFTSYVENHTPSAWRVFWYYGPGSGFVTIHSITPHP